MNAPLVQCLACSRHIRATASACPFCRADMPEGLEHAVIARVHPEGGGRLAMGAVGLGLLAVMTACYGGPTNIPGPLPPPSPPTAPSSGK
jgi:hypothetical protein